MTGLSSLSSLTSCSRKQLLLGSLALTIYALTEAPDIVLGISFHNRNESGTEDVFGLLLDRVPIPVLINQPNLSSTEEFFAHIGSQQRVLWLTLRVIKLFKVSKEARGHKTRPVL